MLFSTTSGTLSGLAILLLSGVLVWIVALYIRSERIIKRHGGHAPRVGSRIPFDLLGLDFVWDFIRHGLRNEYLKFTHNCFVRTGAGRNNPYTFEVYIGGMRALWTADPENIKALLATRFDKFGRGEAFRRRWLDVLGSSVFNLDGQAWHDSRQRLRPLFSRQRISNLECFERHVQRLMKHLEGGQAVDLKDLVSRFALDATADYAFGRNVGALDDRKNDFLDALERIKRVQSVMECAGPLSFLVPRIGFKRDVQTLNDFLMPSILEAISLSRAKLDAIDKADTDWTFLHACAAVSSQVDFLKYELMSVMLAGRDTVSSTLTWTLIELSRNAALVADLRREIARVVGLQVEAGDGVSPRRPTLADLKQMRLVFHTLNETLRLYPTVSLNYRCALTDTSLPRGGGLDGTGSVGVQAGTPVIFSSHILQLSPDTYQDVGPGFTSPHIYDPYRWESWTPRQWTYIPFGAGPRVCLGQQLALTEMAYVLVRILQRFSHLEQTVDVPGNSSSGWERPQGTPSHVEKFLARNVKISGDITLSPRDTILMRFAE